MIQFNKLTSSDLDEVSNLEKICHSLPWSKALFENELKNEHSLFVVAKEDGKLAGYGGIHLIFEEINIVDLAVAPAYRRQGLGEKILKELFSEALKKGAKFATLEVRAGNTPAIKLYEKLGFINIAIRKKYYSDNNEDAAVMWLNPLIIK